MKAHALRCGLAAVAAAALVWASPAGADDAEAPEPSPAAAEMLESMREKGILTEEQYQDIYRKQALYEKEQREKDALPGWLEGWSFGGDLRLRFDRQDWGEPPIGPGDELTPGVDNVNLNTQRAQNQRDRGRFRLRVGASKELGYGVDVAFRLVTSTPTAYGTQIGRPSAVFATAEVADPRSLNASFTDFFSPKSVFFDRAFLSWEPGFAPGLLLRAGKMPNPFVSGNFTDFLFWDNDIQPEGVAATYHLDLWSEYLWSDTAAAYYFLSEVGSVHVDRDDVPLVSVIPRLDERDPYMWGVQQALTAQPWPWLRMGGRASYYDLMNLDTFFAAATMELGNSAGAIEDNPILVLAGPTSPFYTNGRSSGRIRELVLDVFMTFDYFGDRWQVTPFFQWLHMLSAVNDDQAYGVGITFGDEEFLELTVMYAKLQRNGSVALFTDSNLFDGLTNGQGWYVEVERRLTSFLKLRGAFFQSRMASEECDAAQALRNPLVCDNAFVEFPAAYAAARRTALDRYRLQLDLIAEF